MLYEFLESGDENSKFQALIELYRSEFRNRSGGFELPSVNYIGCMSKNGKNNENLDSQIFVSIPVKNQAQIIISVITTLIENTDHPFTIGLLFDNCDDQSERVSIDFFKANFRNFEKLSQVLFIRSQGDLFEATCENILLLFCESPYFVSMQADIYLADNSFFERSLKGFDKLPNLFALSGRAITLLDHKSNITTKILSLFVGFSRLIEVLKLKKNLKILGPYFPGLKYFGDVSDPPKTRMKFNSREFQTIFLGESVIRGPVIWRTEVLKHLSGFNDVAHVLGRDECDISLRAINSGYVVGYLPTLSYSYKEMGTSRKKRTVEVQKQLSDREKIAEQNPSNLTLYWSGFLKLNKPKNMAERKIYLGENLT